MRSLKSASNGSNSPGGATPAVTYKLVTATSSEQEIMPQHFKVVDILNEFKGTQKSGKNSWKTFGYENEKAFCESFLSHLNRELPRVPPLFCNIVAFSSETKPWMKQENNAAAYEFYENQTPEEENIKKPEISDVHNMKPDIVVCVDGCWEEINGKKTGLNGALEGIICLIEVYHSINASHVLHELYPRAYTLLVSKLNCIRAMGMQYESINDKFWKEVQQFFVTPKGFVVFTFKLEIQEFQYIPVLATKTPMRLWSSSGNAFRIFVSILLQMIQENHIVRTMQKALQNNNFSIHFCHRIKILNNL